MLNFVDIQAAATRLKGVAHRTPILTSTTLNRMLGCEVFMKAENFQRMGAFKFRGGYNAINSLTGAERTRGAAKERRGDEEPRGREAAGDSLPAGWCDRDEACDRP